MNNIKELNIYGFKKFKQFHMEFNNNINILVGENEAGKSTILEAINIVLNQQYRNSDKSILKDLINIDNINTFKSSPCLSNLPQIKIELILNLDEHSGNLPFFFGENNISKKEQYGILFTCQFMEEYFPNVEEEINGGKIPLEYYELKWECFTGLSYSLLKKPFNFLYIDTSSTNGIDTFNYFNKTIFNSKYSQIEKMNAKNSFREELHNLFENLQLAEINPNQKFNINDKKIILENILSIYENDISLENMGAGTECLIKTKIALDKSSTNIDVILLEEPETHLSHSSMLSMIAEINKRQNNSQLIITTHSDLIACSLKLKNIFWINNSKAVSLKDIDQDTSDFFLKSSNNNLLQFLLSEKVILVEGPTEYMFIPEIIKKDFSLTLESSKISIISCNGISYKRLLNIAKQTNKKVAVITDNDGKDSNISYMNDWNSNNSEQKIFMDPDVSNWTWEVCFYNLNKSLCDTLITIDDDAKYEFNKRDIPEKHLGKMLNDKVESAYSIIKSQNDFTTPDYIKAAIQWLIK